jgi:hypothetical protein
MSRAAPEPDSFEAPAMPLFTQLYNFAQWLTQDRTEAEDLVQETYVKALKGFSSFQLGTNFRAWMYRILRNTFRKPQHCPYIFLQGRCTNDRICGIRTELTGSSHLITVKQSVLIER